MTGRASIRIASEYAELRLPGIIRAMRCHGVTRFGLIHRTGILYAQQRGRYPVAFFLPTAEREHEQGRPIRFRIKSAHCLHPIIPQAKFQNLFALRESLGFSFHMIRAVDGESKLFACATRHVSAERLSAARLHSTWRGRAKPFPRTPSRGAASGNGNYAGFQTFRLSLGCNTHEVTTHER